MAIGNQHVCRTRVQERHGHEPVAFAFSLLVVGIVQPSEGAYISYLNVLNVPVTFVLGFKGTTPTAQSRSAQMTYRLASLAEEILQVCRNVITAAHVQSMHQTSIQSVSLQEATLVA